MAGNPAMTEMTNGVSQVSLRQSRRDEVGSRMKGFLGAQWPIGEDRL